MGIYIVSRYEYVEYLFFDFDKSEPFNSIIQEFLAMIQIDISLVMSKGTFLSDSILLEIIYLRISMSLTFLAITGTGIKKISCWDNFFLVFIFELVELL